MSRSTKSAPVALKKNELARNLSRGKCKRFFFFQKPWKFSNVSQLKIVIEGKTLKALL